MKKPLRIRPSRETIGERTRTHGMGRTPTYTSWGAMIQRCTNPNLPSFEQYGKIGVKVCRRWLRFENFLQDMGARPSLDYSIDRFPKKDGDYKPGNCRWATRSQQCLNRKTTRPVVRGDGKRFPSIKEAAESVNGDRRQIQDCCAGNQKTHLGHTYRYAT